MFQRLSALTVFFFAMFMLLWLSHRAKGGDPSIQDGSFQPDLVLWAWDRPEDLRFLGVDLDAGQTVAVAPLISTLRLSADGIEMQSRHHPLVIPRGIEVIAVVRIELMAGNPPILEPRLIDEVAERVLGAIVDPRPEALQIDFDARFSERAFYRSLLQRLRVDLPAEIGLQMTALASWCIGDTWIRDLPIEAAVPMYFRMGRDSHLIRRHLESGGDVSLDICRNHLGLSTDEPWPKVPSRRRIFLFHPQPWDARAYMQARAELGASS